MDALPNMEILQIANDDKHIPSKWKSCVSADARTIHGKVTTILQMAQQCYHTRPHE